MKLLLELIGSGKFEIWISFTIGLEMLISYVNILIYNQLFNIDKSSIVKLVILNASSNIIFLIMFEMVPVNIFVTLSMFVIYFVLKMFKAKLEANEVKQKLGMLEAQNKVLISLNDSMHSIKHDFSNFLLVLNGYAKVNDIKGIRNMIKEELKEFNIVNNLAMLDPKVINNPAIYSVMANKFLDAERENIDIHVEVLTDLKDEKFESYEFYRIFSILLDNAIEAAKKCDRRYVSIKFVNDNKKNQELVIIENSFSNVDIDINRIFEKGYTTKKIDTKSHGIGLWNVSRILQRNNKIDLFTSKGEMFKQQIELY